MKLFVSILGIILCFTIFYWSGAPSWSALAFAIVIVCLVNIQNAVEKLVKE